MNGAQNNAGSGNDYVLIDLGVRTALKDFFIVGRGDGACQSRINFMGERGTPLPVR